MKKMLFFFLVISTYIFSQGWNSIVTTSIYEPNAEKIDLFTNKDGNHIVVQNSNGSNSIKYYLLNSSGSLVRSATIESSGGAEFPNISGDDEKIYLVYKLGEYLRFKKSTDAGSSWGNAVNQSIGSNTCNGVDIVYNIYGLHVVYAMRDNYPDYETYYRLISNDQWGGIEYVTGYQDEVGGFPSVAVSENMVHVSYNTNTGTFPGEYQGTAKVRDKYYDNWQTPQTVTGQSETSAREKLQVRTNKLYDFYYDFWVDLGQYSFELKVRSRDLSGTEWSNYSTISAYSDPVNFIGAEQTADEKLHILYGSGDVRHRYFDGSSWSDIYYFDEYTSSNSNVAASAVANDLFVIWKPYSGNYLKYRQYDTSPLAPTISMSGGWGQNPVLSWTNNGEPDIDHFILKIEYNFGGGWGNPTYINPATSPYTDVNIVRRRDGELIARYSVQAIDKSDNASDYSDYVSTSGQSTWKNSASHQAKDNNFVYALNENYPNPFNPSTVILYSIKEEGMVTLKVFDLLGREIAALINDYQPAGKYEVEFYAEDIPSGTYIYTLNANGKVLSRKMQLLK